MPTGKAEGFRQVRRPNSQLELDLFTVRGDSDRRVDPLVAKAPRDP